MKNKLTVVLFSVIFLLALVAAFVLTKLSENRAQLETIITVSAPSNQVIDKKLASIARIIAREGRLHIDTAYTYARYIITSADKNKLSPTLILAVISTESTFKSHAQNVNSLGLMQIMAKIHKIHPVEKLYNPEYNIQVGSNILKDSIRRGGSIAGGLSLYNGSYGVNTVYSDKVLAKKAKYDRLIYT